MPMLTLIYTYGATTLHYTAPKGHLFVTELFLAARRQYTYLVDEDDQTAFDLSLAVTIMMSVG